MSLQRENKYRSTYNGRYAPCEREMGDNLMVNGILEYVFLCKFVVQLTLEQAIKAQRVN
jgi:hypothetical protein